MQPCTLNERRFLANYLKDRGLTLFFLINAWDRVGAALVDPSDRLALEEAQGRLRQVFGTHLREYCGDRYGERVFEISALEALRRRLKDREVDLEGTGFPQLFAALNRFLIGDRLRAEFQVAAKVARRSYDYICDAIERRIPLLDETSEGLKERIVAVESEFGKLEALREEFRASIRERGDREAQEIADDFKTYLLDLEKTFDEDFVAAQPDLEFVDFLERNNRELSSAT